MTFGYLLSAYCFDEIVEEFKALWRVNAPEQAVRWMEENLPVASGVRREAFVVLYPFEGAMGRVQSIGRHELHCA